MSVLALDRRAGRVFTVNPVAKIAALLPLTLCLLSTLDWVSAAVAVVGELVLFLAVGLRSPRLWLRTVPLLVAAPLTGLTMVLYGRPSGQTYLQLGLVHVTDGSIADASMRTSRS